MQNGGGARPDVDGEPDRAPDPAEHPNAEDLQEVGDVGVEFIFCSLLFDPRFTSLSPLSCQPTNDNQATTLL